MFKKDSILYQVNIFSKLIGIILFLITIILLQNIALIVLLSIGLFIISKNYKYISIYSLITLLITILISFFPQILWISKMLVMINYIIIVNKITYVKDVRYLVEKTLYKFQNKKLTYNVLYKIYILKYMKKNYRKLNNLIDEYGLIKNYETIKFLHKKAYIKAKNEIEEVINIINLRFYNYSKERTYIDKPTWERWDNKYILVFLIILLFVIVYGR